MEKNMNYKGYEAVVGLEVHVELKTREKAFCHCKAEFGGEPSSRCCPVCLGEGGEPTVNPEAVELAVLAGLALGCEIAPVAHFDRKHYVSDDMPKGYQLTQYHEPLCTNGALTVSTSAGEKRVGITRIHMEEDAGKRYTDGNEVKLDLNRCGIPLIEIVTEPDIRTEEEAMAVLDTLRGELLFAGVSDCKMNEGSLRCDVNISVRPVGDGSLGTRCEIKNVGSVKAVGKAVRHELERQTELIISGGEVACETRRFDEDRGVTVRMRDKESSEDYGYDRDIGVRPAEVSRELLRVLRSRLPASQGERMERLCSLGVFMHTASLICKAPSYADYFDAVCEVTDNYDKAAKLFVSEIMGLMDSGESYATPEELAECADMLAADEISIVTARELLKISAADGVSPRAAATERGLFIERDRNGIARLVTAAVEACPKAADDVRGGKPSAKKSIVGYVMRLSRGKADPVAVNEEVDKYFSN